MKKKLSVASISSMCLNRTLQTSPLVQQLAKNWLWFKLSFKKKLKTKQNKTHHTKKGGWTFVRFPACSSLILEDLGKAKGKKRKFRVVVTNSVEEHKTERTEETFQRG